MSGEPAVADLREADRLDVLADAWEHDRTPRHPVTGRFMAGGCEVDCLEHCAGMCGATGTPRGDT